MDIWHVVAAIFGFGVGGSVAALLGMRAVRHEKRMERLGFVASLSMLADGIGEDSDPRRITVSLRLKAEQWQRSADALKPTTTVRERCEEGQRRRAEYERIMEGRR